MEHARDQFHNSRDFDGVELSCLGEIFPGIMIMILFMKTMYVFQFGLLHAGNRKSCLDAVAQLRRRILNAELGMAFGIQAQLKSPQFGEFLVFNSSRQR